MFTITTGVGELVLRAVLVYVFLFTVFRLGEDKSVAGGLISAATLIGLVHLANYFTWRSKKVERIFEGVPKILVRNGQVNKEAMAEEKVTYSELIEALRREGHTSLANIRFAILENDGTITVGARAER